MGSVALLAGFCSGGHVGALALIFSFRSTAGPAVAWGEMVGGEFDRYRPEDSHGPSGNRFRLGKDRPKHSASPGHCSGAAGALLTVMSHGGSARTSPCRSARPSGRLADGAVFYGLFLHLIPRLLMAALLFADRELVVYWPIILSFGSAWTSHALGLSPALGAFLAGMLLAESTVFVSDSARMFGSLRTLFVTLFFTSVECWPTRNGSGNWQEVLLWLGVGFSAARPYHLRICMVSK